MQESKSLIQVGYMGRITYFNRETQETTYAFIGRTTKASGMTPYVNSGPIVGRLRRSCSHIENSSYQGPLKILKAEIVRIEQRVVSVEQEVTRD